MWPKQKRLNAIFFKWSFSVLVFGYMIGYFFANKCSLIVFCVNNYSLVLFVCPVSPVENVLHMYQELKQTWGTVGKLSKQNCTADLSIWWL